MFNSSSTSSEESIPPSMHTGGAAEGGVDTNNIMPQVTITHKFLTSSSSNTSTPSDDGSSCNRSDDVSFTPTSAKNQMLKASMNNHDHGEISPISIGLNDTIVHVPNSEHSHQKHIVSKELLRVKIGETPELSCNEESNKHNSNLKFPLDRIQSACSIDLDAGSTRTIVRKPKKKTIFSVFQNNSENADEEPIVYTFFDLEKPAKKKSKKGKKTIIGSIYKVSILVLLFCALSSIVVFGISMDNSSSNHIGYFTAGSPATIVWTSAFHMAFSLIFIFDLFGPLFLLRWYRRIVSFIEKKGLIHDNFTRQINIDGYSAALFARIFWGAIIVILNVINWVCYGLYSENRERLSGWISFFFIISPISYFVISYRQFKKFRKANIVIFELKEEKWFGEEKFFKTRICCRFTTIIKILTYIFLAMVCALFILFTTQSVSLTQEEYKVPGTLYSIKMSNSQLMSMHMYCEGDEESEDAVLIDADVGVASPYAYMKNLVSLLGKNGMRACVMERGGYGFSDSGPFPRDLTNTSMTEMVSLVKEASFKTPFVLISHSKASFTARTMMEYHRKLLRGVILLHPSHEKEETYLLSNVYNYTDAQVQSLLDEKRYIANTIRFVSPIGFTRYFSNYFFQKLPFTLGNVHERYHMNGWKTYFGSFPNSTVQHLTKYNQHTININKFTNAIWGEIDDMKNATQNILAIRAKREQYHLSNATLIVPVTILTSGRLLNGTCEDNYISPQSAVCNDFLQHQQQRASGILSMHKDLALYYNSTKLEWKVVDSDFDMAVNQPNIILAETLKIMAINQR